LNVSHYRALELADLERQQHTFIVFNPEPETRRTRIRLGGLGASLVSIGSTLETLEPAPHSDDGIELALGSSEVLYLRVTPK
jgi:hypothetical protein